ncbi:MAG TPA: hypothetical protein VGA17_06445 [Nitrospiraceae bacterium]|jgi:metal-responsive CopG/Arc/MetJ family transcriptional regulator
MKAIQVLFDEMLLRRLDSDAEVKKEGRSAVLRRAAVEYLRKKRKERIAAAYRRGYRAGGIEDEFPGWENEGVWPEN